MQIHPAIAALRINASEQAAMQAQFEDALANWHADDQTQAILQEIKQFADGTPLEDCPGLDRLMSDPQASNDFIQNWQKSFIAAFREYPLGVPGFDHRVADGLSHIVLLSERSVSLGITAFEGHHEKDFPATAAFCDGQTHEIVVSGSAKGVLHEVRQCHGLDSIIDTCSAQWRPGATIVTNGPCEARQVVCVDGAMVVLQLSRQAPNPQPTREYSLRDGELIQMASGARLASQKIMALSVLGAMAAQGEAKGAVIAMVQCAENLDEGADVRWEAVRQTLALNPPQGIALLEDIAKREDDPLIFPAQDLRDALRSDQPELENLFGGNA